MKKSAIIAIAVCVATVLCAYLTRIEFEITDPREHGEYHFHFRFGHYHDRKREERHVRHCD